MVSVQIGWGFPEVVSLKTEHVCNIQARSSPHPLELKQKHEAKTSKKNNNKGGGGANEGFGGQVQGRVNRRTSEQTNCYTK